MDVPDQTFNDLVDVLKEIRDELCALRRAECRHQNNYNCGECAVEAKIP